MLTHPLGEGRDGSLQGLFRGLIAFLLAPPAALHSRPLQPPLAGYPISISTLLQTLGQPQLYSCLVFVTEAGGLRPAKGSLGHMDRVEHGCALQVLYLNALLCKHLNPHQQLPVGPGISPPDLFTCCDISIN